MDSTATYANNSNRHQPGSNPNKDNAKRRLNNRPRTKNSSSPPKATETRWIDPLPHVNPINADLTQNVVSLPSGEFEIDFDLPRRIAQPFADAFRSVSQRTIENIEVVTRASTKIEALGFYKAAKQLYSTMTDPEKGINQPLKIVYYDSSQVPTSMAAALSMIGHLDTKFGKFYLRNASTLFKRWIVNGLYIDPDSDLPDDIPASAMVWNDHDGYNLIRRLVLNRVNDLRQNVYNIIIGEVPLRYSIPAFTDTTDVVDYYNNILPDREFTEELRDLVSLYTLTRTNWVTGNAAFPNGRDQVAALARIGLVIAPETHADRNLRSEFEVCMASYMTSDSMHVSGLFNMTDSPSGQNGFAAQLVQATNNQASTTLPISDNDMSFGFAFNPLSDFSFSPRIVAYSKTSQEQAAAAIAQRDLRSIAI